MRLTWFPGSDPTTIRLLAEGISVTTGKPTAYVQIFQRPPEHITTAAAIAAAKAGRRLDRRRPHHVSSEGATP